MNSKKNRPKIKEINARREQERRQIRKFLADMKEECYAPAIQLELPFTYERPAKVLKNDFTDDPWVRDMQRHGFFSPDFAEKLTT